MHGRVCPLPRSAKPFKTFEVTSIIDGPEGRVSIAYRHLTSRCMSSRARRKLAGLDLDHAPRRCYRGERSTCPASIPMGEFPIATQILTMASILGLYMVTLDRKTEQ